MNQILDESLIPQAVYEEICVKGRGLPGDTELRRLLNEGLVTIRKIRNRVLLRMIFDAKLIDKNEFIRALETLKTSDLE